MSVTTSCTDVTGIMLHKLRRPNLLESQTATVRRAISTMARLTCASSRFGVNNPARVSKPSTPKNKMSALNCRSVCSASGPTSENEFLRNVPPVSMTSMCVPANSAAMLIAFVITVSCDMSFNARAIAVVVVPESSSTDWPSSTSLDRGLGNAQLLTAVELFFLAQRGIEQRPRLHRQCASVRALDCSLAVQNLEILTNRNLRNLEVPGQVLDQHTPIAVHRLQDLRAAFFVKQAVRGHGKVIFRFLSNSNFR